MFNNTLRSLVLLLLSLWIQPAHSMDIEQASEIKDESSNPLNRVILIFLDDSELEEKKIGPITSEFLYAFDQEAAPIIVSASIINHALQGFEDIVFYAVDLKKRLTDKWVTKKINDTLYLLIPKMYLDALHVNIKEVESYTVERTVTPEEQELGLNVNHMITVRDIATIESYSRTIFAPLYLYNIFMSTKAYRGLNSKKIPSWTIFVDGHGGVEVLIAGMPLDEFDSFLRFAQNNLRVKLLYYSTCYGAGISSNRILKDLTGTIDKNYSFPIVTAGLTDATTYGKRAAVTISRYGNLILATHPSFNGFIAEAVKNFTDYKKLVNYLVPQDIFGRSIAGLTPQIKYPGLPWLSVVDDTAIVSIGSILARNRSAPLDIETFFARGGKKRSEIYGILLYAKDIPFEIVVNVKNKQMSGIPPEIISMIPGMPLHHIKGLSSNYYKVQSFLDSFLKTVYVGTTKVFIIDIIKGVDGIYKDVVVLLTDKGTTIYYIDTSNVLTQVKLHEYEVIPSFKTVVLEEEKKEYIGFLKSVKPESEIVLLQNRQNANTLLGSLKRNLGLWWTGVTTELRLFPIQKSISTNLNSLLSTGLKGGLATKVMFKRLTERLSKTKN